MALAFLGGALADEINGQNNPRPPLVIGLVVGVLALYQVIRAATTEGTAPVVRATRRIAAAARSASDETMAVGSPDAASADNRSMAGTPSAVAVGPRMPSGCRCVVV